MSLAPSPRWLALVLSLRLVGGCTLPASTCKCGDTACSGGATFRPRKADTSLWCNDGTRYFCDCRPACGAQCGACRRCDALPCATSYHRINCGWGSPGLCVKCSECAPGTIALAGSCTSWSDTICTAPPTPSPTPVSPTPAPTPAPHPLAARAAVLQAAAAARAAAGSARANTSSLAGADLRLLRAASDAATLDVLGRAASAADLASAAAVAAALAAADFSASVGFSMSSAALTAYATETSASASALSATEASAVASAPAITSGVLDRSALAQLLAVLSNLVSGGRAATALAAESAAGAGSSAAALSTSFEAGVEAAARAILANKAGVVDAALSEGGELQYLLLDDDADRSNSLGCCGPATAFGQLRSEVDAMAALCASLGGGATLVTLHSAQEVRQVLRPLVVGAGYVFAEEGFETAAKRAAQTSGPGAGTAYSRGVPLARDIDGTNTYFDLTSESRSVQPILDALRSDHGFTGDILTHEFVKGSAAAAGEGNQQCAGLGLHQASAAGALADWECKSGTAALLCQKVVQQGANLDSWRANATEVSLGPVGAGDFYATVRRAAVPRSGAALVLEGPAGTGNASVPSAAAALAAGASGAGASVGAVLWRNPSLWGALEAGAAFASDAALGLRLLREDGSASATAVRGLDVADSVTIELPLGSGTAASTAVLAGPANGSISVGALQCRSWDTTRSMWATEGCTTLHAAPDATPAPGAGAVSCLCSHLSEFALVRAPPPPPPQIDVDCDATAFHTAAATATLAYAACVEAAGGSADKMCDCVSTFNCLVRKYATCPGDVGARVTANQNGQLCTLYGACLDS